MKYLNSSHVCDLTKWPHFYKQTLWIWVYLIVQCTVCNVFHIEKNENSTQKHNKQFKGKHKMFCFVYDNDISTHNRIILTLIFFLFQLFLLCLLLNLPGLGKKMKRAQTEQWLLLCSVFILGSFVFYLKCVFVNIDVLYLIFCFFVIANGCST